MRGVIIVREMISLYFHKIEVLNYILKLFRYFCLQLRVFYLWGGGLKIPVRVTEAEPKQIGVSLKASGELNFGKYVLEPCIAAVGENTKITLLTNSPLLKTKCNGNLGSSIHFPLPTPE